MLGGGIAALTQGILAAPTMSQSNQCAYRKKSPQIEGTFCTSKTAPDRSRAVKEALCVITILRCQIPQPFPGTGKKQFAFQWRPGRMCLHQLVHPEGAGITGRLLILNVTVKVVGMEGAEQAAACLRLQAPYLSVIGVAHGTGPAHFHQRIAVGEQGQFALPAPAALFPHDPHVHIVGVQIQGQGTLVRFVAQQLSSYKPFHYLDFIVIGTLSGHTALPAILSKRPERDTGNMGTPKVRQEIAV